MTTHRFVFEWDADVEGSAREPADRMVDLCLGALGCAAHPNHHEAECGIVRWEARYERVVGDAEAEMVSAGTPAQLLP